MRAPLVVLAAIAAVTLTSVAAGGPAATKQRVTIETTGRGSFTLEPLRAGPIKRGSASPASAAKSKIAAIRVSTDPGGSRLELYVVNADGSGSWLLEIARPSPATISYELGSSPAWSPDGRKIAFVGMGDDGNTDVYIVGADGLGRKRLTRHPGVDGNPAWSPDGRKIAFTRGARECCVGKTYIYLMNADGSRQRRLARGHVHFSVAWSPDGQKMLFERPNPRHPAPPVPGDFAEDLHVMNADGSGQRNLTRNPAQDMDPVWSPDGRRIAFDRERRGRGNQRWVMNPDGSGKRRLAPARWRSGGPDWSPDGRKIAFEARESTSPHDGVFVMNADGSERRRLTHGGSPSRSPDGSKIAFGGRAPTSPDGGVFVMNADGSERRRLTQRGGSPSWSPDGEWIAYESGTPGRLPQEIWAMRPDGSGERMLMRSDRGVISQVLPWAWSPTQG